MGDVIKLNEREVKCELGLSYIDKILIRVKNADPMRDLKEAALVTVGKEYDGNIVSDEYKMYYKYFISEHSPIRNIDIMIYLYNIPYYNSVHFARHVHTLHFVKSNRPDITGKSRSVDDRVNHIMSCNSQSLIDMMRKRLCNKCDEITKSIAYLIKDVMSKSDISLLVALSECLMPNCKYRGFCPEFSSCNKS